MRHRIWWGRALAAAFFAFTAAPAGADALRQTKDPFRDAFRQLDADLPTPNSYRAASGAPGHAYWQQQVDYVIRARLDEDAKRIIATETITYRNNSPDTLTFIWVHLDQNRFRNESLARRSETTLGGRDAVSGAGDTLAFTTLRREQAYESFEGGFDIQAVTDADGAALAFTEVDALMRVDLPTRLAPGGAVEFTIAWEHAIIHREEIGGRSGYERFADSDTYQYALAQWFPRVAAYTDYEGWHTLPFLGRGEFTLEFGDYDVSITVPADHVVASTGVLQNPSAVLTREQRRRLDQARTADAPVFIVTPEEAAEAELGRADGEATWRFTAENVRDFAWASSRKYIWDAMGVEQDDAEQPRVLAMSFYPNEAEPLWSRYSTHAVAHTLDVYNRMSFAYPYPNAISVNAWRRGGMEYPMITFNGYRPTTDAASGERVYPRRDKYGLISVIIHEIGHIYFPMVVNTDERQWTWMDEGLNTFLQRVAEVEWEADYPTWWGSTNLVDDVAPYMASAGQVPIMTQSDAILQFGNNAYLKPAAALMVLRETVLGRELFDFAFREFSTRWRFKRPTPADFFRTMEEASGVDLDWFWRGWFYSTDHIDITVADMRVYRVSSQDPAEAFALDREEAARRPENLAQRRNRDAGVGFYVDDRPELRDVYSENDRFTVTNADRNTHAGFRRGLAGWEREALDRAVAEGSVVHFIAFDNVGGLVTPLPLEFTFADGSRERFTAPAEIWRRSAEHVTKLFIRPQEIVSVRFDPDHALPDVDRAGDTFPPVVRPSRIELFKQQGAVRNMMADMLADLEGEEADADADVPLEASGSGR